MIPRRAYKTIERAFGRQAAVAVLGPRQVGKTTLALEIGRKRQPLYLYLDLEARNDRAKLAEPELFLTVAGDVRIGYLQAGA